MKEFPLIEVSGAAYQIGREHGRQPEPLVRKYLEWIDKLTGIEHEKLRGNALRFLLYIQKLSPAYVDEIFGLADGAALEMPARGVLHVQHGHGSNGTWTRIAYRW